MISPNKGTAKPVVIPHYVIDDFYQSISEDFYPFPKERGGLRMLPGTHKQNLFSLFFRKKYYIDNTPDPNEAGFDIEAGDLTIHHGTIWHRVQPSAVTGEQSRRRVMYIPIVTGAPQYKHAESRTPFYHATGCPGRRRFPDRLMSIQPSR